MKIKKKKSSKKRKIKKKLSTWFVHARPNLSYITSKWTHIKTIFLLDNFTLVIIGATEEKIAKSLTGQP